jgi:N-acetylmuramoyl-L-alanine amidase
MHLKRGFNDIGYHFLVYLDGSVHAGRPIEKVGAHVAGHNTGTVGIAYVGGITASGAAKDTRTPAQKAALRSLLADLVHKYGIKHICGHRDFSPDKNHNGKVDSWERIKECPCFDAIPEYADLV